MEIKIINDEKIWYYRVKKLDEKYLILDFIKKFNFSSEDFIKLNPHIEKLVAGKILFMPPSSKYCHVVAPLENFETIAKTYNCSIDYLKINNNINRTFIGQKIFL